MTESMNPESIGVPPLSAFAPEMWTLGGWPLGMAYDPDDKLTSFAVYAPDATRIVLEIFTVPFGQDAVFSVPLGLGEDGCWRGQLFGAGPGVYYGYRAWGRNWDYSPEWTPGSLLGFHSDRDEKGNHFNPNKLILDPYALEISHVPMTPKLADYGVDRGVFGTGGGLWRGQVRRSVDTGRYAPKAVVLIDDTSTGEPPMIAGEDSAIYEAHVKNLTMHPASSRLGDLLGGEPGLSSVANVPAELRGTYAGAAYLAPYLAGMGLTTLELLPVHETDSDQVGDHNGSTNNWGYQTVGFFAPNRDYAHDKSPGGPTREFKEMVRAFHDAGIEVYLDVVFNHTGEGGNWDGDIDSAGFFCFGGLATSHYYDLTPDGFVIDGATGSANQTNFSRRVMRDLVIDSLKYWHLEMGVDGFRFDLAPVLGRSPSHSAPDQWGERRRFFNAHPLLREVADMAEEMGIEVIAEAWDLWGYEVGNFPAGWGEWNGRFRDAMRDFLKGTGDVHAFMETFNGDWQHFSGNVGPHKSINFLTAHDGFTMFDLVSFNNKENNQPYPFGPSDGGSDSNLSWDSGGDRALRRTRWRNNILVTFMARGVPMIVSGDEYGRTQNGNNNPWDLNTIGIWNNWAQAVSNTPTLLPVDPADPSVGAYYDVVGQCDSEPGINPLFRFAQYIFRLRAMDRTLRQRTWGALEPGPDSVSYLYWNPDFTGHPAAGDRQLTVAINGAAISGTDYLVMINMLDRPRDFVVPSEPDELRPGLVWRRIIDTAAWAEHRYNTWMPGESEAITASYAVQPWSIAVLAAADPGSPIFDEANFRR